MQINAFIRQVFTAIKQITKRDITDFLQAIVFCVLFACSVSIMPALKNGISAGKQFFFVFTAGAVSIISFYKFRRTVQNITYKISAIDVFVIAYLIYVFAKTWITQLTPISDMGLIQWMLMGIFYLTAKSFFTTKNTLQQNTIILILMGFGLFQAIYGLQQLYGYELSNHSSFKVTGSFFNPAPFSGYLISIFPFALAVYHFTPDKCFWSKIIKYSGIITVLTILLIIPAALSRASWIALVAGATVVYAGYYHIPSLFNTYLKNKAVKLVAYISIIILLLSAGTGLFYWKKDSAMGRVLIWEITLNMIKENPLIGVGFGQYSAVFGQQQIDYFQSEEYTGDKVMVAGKGEYAFNELLRITAEQGFIGLLLFLGIFYSILRNKQFRERVGSDLGVLVGASGGLVAILVFSMFSYPFSITPILLNFFFFVAILSAKSVQKPLFEVNFSIAIRLIVFIFLIVFSSWGVIMAKEKYNASIAWKEASNLKSYGDYDGAIHVMAGVEPIMNSNGDFMFEYGQALTLNEDYEKGIEVLEKAAIFTSDPYIFNSLGKCYQSIRDYENAEKAYIHGFYLIPHKFYPRYLLAKLYDEMGEREKAIATAHLLLNMKVKVPSIAIEEMKEEMEELVK